MKVIYLAFANSSKSPLPELTEEDYAVYEILSDRYLRGDFFIHKESFATIDKVNYALKKYKDNLAIFHFSGHAGKDSLLLNEENANSNGIANQLKYCAENGILEMVILNGCSTAGQVAQLKANKIPVIIATSAPVDDQSAKVFSIRFWQNLVKNHSIEESFEDAKNVAETVSHTLTSTFKNRDIGLDIFSSQKPEDGVWLIDFQNHNLLKRNPLPFKKQSLNREIQPNEALIETLYNSLKEAGNHQIESLFTNEKNGVTIRKNEKTSAYLNNIPHPIGIHLQRLLCPQSPLDYSEDSPNVFGPMRLRQIGQLYQTTTEFLGIIMIAQIWELALQFQGEFEIGNAVKEKLLEYIELPVEQRKIYDYIPLIQLIREHLKLNNFNGEIKSFIDEQEFLSDLFIESDDFFKSCKYLYNLRKQSVRQDFYGADILQISYEAEDNLCSFMKPLGFIHRYNLVSIQQIDILKFRHHSKNKNTTLDYKHRIVRCMQSTGDDEYDYYYMPSFVDNWSVMLIKTKLEETIDNKRRKYKVIPIDYLNLSPFVIDRNSFIHKSNLSYIMFFNGVRNYEKGIFYQWVRNPMNPRDSFEIGEEEEFEPIRLQFEAFKSILLPSSDPTPKAEIK